jgi:hypothetical protein
MFYLDMYLPGADQIFFFDLDTVITGNIDELLNYRGDFAILRDFYRDGKWKNRPAGYGSAIMSWKPEAKREWWDKFVEAKYPTDRLGDQGLMEQYAGPHADTWQDMFPNQIFSYKVHCKNELPTDARIVCFHGNPPPHKVNNKWMSQNWI